MPPIHELCGWVPHPEDVETILSSLPNPLMQDAAPQLIGTWDGKTDVRLWDACIKVTGANLPADAQGIGDCTSHGSGRGLDYLQCVQIALGNAPNEYVEGKHSAFTEAIYGSMRARAGQLSNNDGGCGIWIVNSLVNDGFPVRNGRTYNAQRAKQWGLQGTPDDIVAEGKSELLKQYIQIRTTRQSADMLSNGYPLVVCSNQGFNQQRDANGVCQAQGSWAHCMLCAGAMLIGGTLHFTLVQSWGQNDPQGPVIKNMPDNSFNVIESVFQRMLNARDTYALTSIPGFPAQKMNFFI